MSTSLSTAAFLAQLAGAWADAHLLPTPPGALQAALLGQGSGDCSNCATSLLFASGLHHPKAQEGQQSSWHFLDGGIFCTAEEIFHE